MFFTKMSTYVGFYLFLLFDMANCKYYRTYLLIYLGTKSEKTAYATGSYRTHM